MAVHFVLHVMVLAAAALHNVKAVNSYEKVLDLGGINWEVRSSNGSVVAPATVPGVVHTDLLAAGIIGEPYSGFNELLLRWVALDNWTFSRSFTVNRSFLDKRTSNALIFDGLDTHANISLNGVYLGISNNSFLRWQTVLPDDILRAGENANDLVVSFTNPQSIGQTAAAAYPVCKSHV